MKDFSFKDVGENILKTLQKKNMTQQNLANLLGISKQVMSKIIHGSKAINILEITKIANILEISVDALLDPVFSFSAVSDFSYMSTENKTNSKDSIAQVNAAIQEILFLESIVGV